MTIQRIQNVRAWHTFKGGRKHHLVLRGSLMPSQTYVTLCGQYHEPMNHVVAVREFEVAPEQRCRKCLLEANKE